MSHHSHPLLVAIASLCLVACEEPVEETSLRNAAPADVEFGISQYVCEPTALDDVRARTPDGQSPVGGRECDYVSNIDRVLDPSSTVDPALCASLERQARDLIARHGQCELDMQCSMYTAAEAGVADTCMAVFECYLGLHTDADISEFAGEARRLDTLYAQAGCLCPVAMCTDPDATIAICDSSSCELDVVAAPTELIQ